jgi:hypothetical protein
MLCRQVAAGTAARFVNGVHSFSPFFRQFLILENNKKTTQKRIYNYNTAHG